MNTNSDYTNGSASTRSPKKKLHIKVTQSSGENGMAEAVSTVRNTLKNARDISSRNLITNQEHGPATFNKSDYDSDYEEVVAIEEEPTDYTPYRATDDDDDDDDDETVEEIVEVEVEVEFDEEIIEDSSSTLVEEDDDDDDALEPIPPPIVIPKAFKVKDDDDENHQCTSDSSTSEGEEDVPDPEEVERKLALSRSSFATVEPKTMVQNVDEKEDKILIEVLDECPKSPPRKELDNDVAARPGTIRGYSYNPELKNPNIPPKKWTRPKKTDEIKEAKPPVSPKRAPTSPKRIIGEREEFTAESSVNKSPDAGAKKWRRPSAPTVIGAPKRAPSLRQLDPDGRLDVSWTKPDWAASGPKLRSTGKSAAENLAKPITNLPHMNKDYSVDDDDSCSKNEKSAANNASAAPVARPAPPRKAASKIICKAPEPNHRDGQTERTKQVVYPKSPGKGIKPSVARELPPPTALDGDEHKPIEWEKPDWATKRVLRSTSKTETLYSGKDIARPIGGIRPVEDK